ncbi:MAG: Ig-like domain-containing protein [Clostridia bacterium]|nr:Ig-like domain-containing protein [Clostridia bacterium]
MKIRLLSLTLAVALILAICPTASAIDVDTVTLSGAKTLMSGKTAKLSAIINPQNASNQNLVWTSSGACASVTDKGVVTARDVDEKTSVTIRATASSGAYGEHEMTITPRAISIELTPSGSSVDLSEGFILFTAKVYPETAEQNVIWSVSNKRIATITSDGLLSLKKKGTVIVKAKVSGQESVTASARVQISRMVTDVTVKGASRLKAGKKTKLSAVLIPKIKKKNPVIWESLTPDIAKVSSSGKVTALAVEQEQTAIIKATARNNPNASGTHEIIIYP